MTHGALFQACCDELPEITFEQAIEQVLNITFKALAMASKSQENDARELVKQLESLVYSLKCNKLKKVFKFINYTAESVLNEFFNAFDNAFGVEFELMKKLCSCSGLAEYILYADLLKCSNTCLCKDICNSAS